MLIGAEEEVLFERPAAGKRGTGSGRSYRQAPEVDGQVLMKNLPENIGPGTFIRVRYTAAAGYDMKASVV